MNDLSITTEFYEEYARNNALDSLQLGLLDMLDKWGGKATWICLQNALKCPRTRLLTTAADLRDQDLVEYNADIVCLNEWADFVIGDVLEDLHDRFDEYARANPQLAEHSYMA